jgi:hypothetical protein
MVWARNFIRSAPLGASATPRKTVRAGPILLWWTTSLSILLSGMLMWPLSTYVSFTRSAACSVPPSGRAFWPKMKSARP